MAPSLNIPSPRTEEAVAQGTPFSDDGELGKGMGCSVGVFRDLLGFWHLAVTD